MIKRVYRTTLLSALGLIPAGVVVQTFPPREDLTALIQSRLEEDRVTGIVLWVDERILRGTRAWQDRPRVRSDEAPISRIVTRRDARGPIPTPSQGTLERVGPRSDPDLPSDS